MIDVTELPTGWLGKPHGLQKGFEASTGEWLVFTDADVKFSPDLLRRAVALAKREGSITCRCSDMRRHIRLAKSSLMTFFALASRWYASRGE